MEFLKSYLYHPVRAVMVNITVFNPPHYLFNKKEVETKISYCFLMCFSIFQHLNVRYYTLIINWLFQLF